jgi:hypothetical protein
MDFSHGYINATMEITVQVWSLPHVTLTITSSFILSITIVVLLHVQKVVLVRLKRIRQKLLNILRVPYHQFTLSAYNADIDKKEQEDEKKQN